MNIGVISILILNFTYWVKVTKSVYCKTSLIDEIDIAFVFIQSKNLFVEKIALEKYQFYTFRLHSSNCSPSSLLLNQLKTLCYGFKNYQLQQLL